MNEQILIIDDDEKFSKMLRFLFMAKSFKVEYVSSGKEALELLEEVKPDLIILDIMMPDMDGFEVCERIKSATLLKSIPIIILSALASSQNRDKAVALGAYDYFEKPFKSADLVSKAIEAMKGDS